VEDEKVDTFNENMVQFRSPGKKPTPKLRWDRTAAGCSPKEFNEQYRAYVRLKNKQPQNMSENAWRRAYRRERDKFKNMWIQTSHANRQGFIWQAVTGDVDGPILKLSTIALIESSQAGLNSFDLTFCDDLLPVATDKTVREFIQKRKEKALSKKGFSPNKYATC